MDYYALLNVSREASLDEIRASYKKLAVTYHPDVHSSNNPEQLEEAKEQFTLIKNAYETLSDDGQRAVYDLYGLEGLRAGWALGAKYPTLEELERAWGKRQQRRQEEIWQAKTGAQSKCEGVISLVHCWDPLNLRYRPPELVALQLTQRAHTAVGTGHVIVEGKLHSANGNGSGVVNVSLVQRWRMCEWSLGGGVNAAGEVHHNGYLSLPLFSRSTATVSLMGTPMALPTVALSGAHKVNHDTSLHGGWTLGPDGGVEVGVSRSRVGNSDTTVTFTVRATGLDSGGAELSLERQLNVDYRLTMRLFTSLSPEMFPLNGRMEVVAKRRWGRYAEWGLGMVASGDQLAINLNWKRGNIKFGLPVIVSQDPTLAGVATALLGLGMGVWLIERWLLGPHRERKRKRKLEQQRSLRAEELARQRTAAEAAVKLMTPTVRRRHAAEEARGGLLIVQGWYGALLQQGSAEGPLDCVVDVTIPLQHLVEDSQLRLFETSKANLLGFYDPAYGEEKQLYIRYLFKDKLHQVTIQDNEPLAIPRKADLIPPRA